MMNKIKYFINRFAFCIVVALVLLAVGKLDSAAKSQVTVDAVLDSSQIYIGQQVKINLEVSTDANQFVQLPRFDSLQSIIPGIIVVSSSPVDSEMVNNGARCILRQKYTITSFDSALYLIPGLKVISNKDTFASKNMALKVYSVDIDTLHPEKVFPCEDIMKPSLTFEDWKPLLISSILCALLALALAYVIVRIKDNKPILRRIKLHPKLAPHKVAMQKIEIIKQENLSAGGDNKQYYTQLIDTLRQYISERFKFNAMEMTTPEIIAYLNKTEDKSALQELSDLFELADLVKFAKYNTELSENDQNLMTVVEYINHTKIEEAPKPQQTEIVVEEKKSKTTKLVLRISVAAFSIGFLALAGYIVYKIYILFL